jgi:ABC-2 type transport system permease protein
MLRIILLLKWKSIGAQMQYPANIITWLVGTALGGVAEIIMILALTSTFGTIGGWDFYQLGFMFSIFRLAYAVHLAVFLPFWWHSDFVRHGQLDLFLVRPAHPLLQILAWDLFLSAFGVLIPALVLFGMTCSHVAVPWTALNIVFLLVVIASGAVIMWAVRLFLNALDFWFVQADQVLEILDPFQYNATRYPIHVYQRSVSFVLTYLLPYAFLAYYPAHYFLGLKVQLGAPWFPFLPPAVAVLTSALAIAFWSLGLRRYESSGT